VVQGSGNAMRTLASTDSEEYYSAWEVYRGIYSELAYLASEYASYSLKYSPPYNSCTI